MKSTSCFLLLFFAFNVIMAQNDPALLTINGKPFLRSEFEYIYNKSHLVDKDKQASLKEGLLLFENYKLKVAEAESMGLDKALSFKNLLLEYRQQVAQTYLTDSLIDDRVARALYDSLKLNGAIPDENMTFGNMKKSLLRFYAVRHEGFTPGTQSIIARVRKYDRLASGMSNKEVLAYEYLQLERKYPEFTHQIQEYHDGILLVEVSAKYFEHNPEADSIALARFFKKHRKDYKWNVPHYKGALIMCKNNDTYKRVKRVIKKIPFQKWDDVVKLNFSLHDSISFESGIYVEGNNRFIDQLIFNKRNGAVGHYPVARTYGKLLKKYPQEYKDVLNLVTADYKEYLEKLWIDSLVGKYKVEINEQVLKTVNDHAKN